MVKQASERNPLYPIFLKLHHLKMLIVGGGEVGTEKLFFILKSSPEANITVVATWFSSELLQLVARSGAKVKLIKKAFTASDVKDYDLIVAATNDRSLNQQVQSIAKEKKILINVADTPDLCDFYLGSIVTRGTLKVAISTNGKSPTFAKRFRQYLEHMLPEEVDDLIHKLKVLRDQMDDDFEEKVKKLNALTEGLTPNEPE